MNIVGNTTVQDRAQVFENVLREAKVLAAFPLLVELAGSRSAFFELRDAVQNFVLKTLNVVNRRYYPAHPDAFDVYFDDIVKLPNITPNGAFYPKRETVLEYNIVQRQVIRLLESAGVMGSISQMQAATLRVNDTAVDRRGDRPYASSKLHSDAWVGHQGDGVLSIPVAGDITYNAIEFFEPVDPAPEFLAPLVDYLEGERLFRDKVQYPIALKFGCCYLFDHLALHRTQRGKGPTGRFVLDMGYALDSPLSRFASGAAGPHERFQYLTRDRLCGIGDRHLVTVSASIFDSAAAVINSAAPSRLIDL